MPWPGLCAWGLMRRLKVRAWALKPPLRFCACALKIRAWTLLLKPPFVYGRVSARPECAAGQARDPRSAGLGARLSPTRPGRRDAPGRAAAGPVGAHRRMWRINEIVRYGQRVARGAAAWVCGGGSAVGRQARRARSYAWRRPLAAGQQGLRTRSILSKILIRHGIPHG